MTAPPYREALVSELSIKKLNQVFNSALGIKDSFSLESYHEQTFNKSIVITLKFIASTNEHRIVLELLGPYFEGMEYRWGVNLDPNKIVTTKEGRDHITTFQGYLSPTT